MVPDSFGSSFGCCFEHAGHAVTALTKSVYFKGNPASLAICHPPGHYDGHSLYAPNLLHLLKGRLLGLISKAGHWLPACQRVSMPYELRCGRQWGLSQTLADGLKCLSTYPDHLVDDLLLHTRTVFEDINVNTKMIICKRSNWLCSGEWEMGVSMSTTVIFWLKKRPFQCFQKNPLTFKWFTSIILFKFKAKIKSFG